MFSRALITFLSLVLSADLPLGGRAEATRTVFTQVDAGWEYTCAVKQDNSLACWGKVPGGPPPNGTDFVRVSAGDTYTCALKQDGSLVCWGDDGYGQATPPFGTDFIQVNAHGFHTCALKRDGSLACWGKNDVGQAAAPNYVLHLPLVLKGR